MPLLFSYGTLRDEDVQRTTFGRSLDGAADELIGCIPSLVPIEDEALARRLGATHHNNISFNDDPSSRVPGTVFTVTDVELDFVDRYEEPFAYARVMAPLASGVHAWVYLHAPRRFAHDLAIEVVHSDHLSDDAMLQITTMCNAAYGEDVGAAMEAMRPAIHFLGRVAGEVVSHAMIVTRWLQPGDAAPARTAYVEMVATRPNAQRNGYATQIMQRLVREIDAAYDMAALSPATHRIYERLGWHFWRGPLSMRMPSGAVERNPDESVMVLDLPGRSTRDVNQPLWVEWRPGEVW